MSSLKNKVTIITGGGAGFGRATAILFAKYGANLVLADLNLAGAEETIQQCKALGLTSHDVLALKADISSEEDRRSIINECVAKFGRIDVLVNNAGLYRVKKLTETSPELYDLMMDVNLKAQIFLTQLAVPYLKQTKGNIVNLSSVAANEALVDTGAYAMSKAAVDKFTQILALGFLFPSVISNFYMNQFHCSPGTIHTELYDVEFSSSVKTRMEQTIPEHPLGRLGTPQDVANAVAFLASDMSSYSTGNSFHVDGGRHCVGARHNPHIQALKQQK